MIEWIDPVTGKTYKIPEKRVQKVLVGKKKKKVKK